MKISVRMFGRFRHQFWETKDLEFPAVVTPLGVLKEVAATNPDGSAALFDDKERIRNHIVLMVNRKRIREADIVSMHLQDSDELAVLPPVAGG